jgi:hypothetical protein
MVEDILYLDNDKLIDYVANNIKEASWLTWKN